MDARHVADQERDQRLQKAQDQLIGHMGQNIGCYMHARAMLFFDNIPLTAHHLDRVEETVPDTDAGQGEGSHGRPLLRDKHVASHDKGHESRYDGADRKNDPVALIDEHAQEFAEIDPELMEASGILQFFG